MTFSDAIAQEVLVRCGRCCCVCHQFCGNKIELHHIVPVEQGGDDSLENCIPVCFDCHAEIGHYNAKHPRGRKFSPEELRQHRKRGFAWQEAASHKQVVEGALTAGGAAISTMERVEDPLLVRVQEVAGMLAESLASGNLRGRSEEEALELLRELLDLQGRLRKHLGLMHALSDFQNTAGWLLRGKGAFESAVERTETLQELEQRFREVIRQAEALQ